MQITGSTLKWIAMGTMVVDHLAAVVLMPAYGISFNGSFDLAGALAGGGIGLLCYVMRLIGRLAFPIFCFLLVEGLIHTHSRPRYLRNLVLLAIASEMPFDLCLRGELVAVDVQNTIWTLVLGFLLCVVIDDCAQAFAPTPALVLKCAAVPIFMALAMLLGTDYDAFGVALIMLLYLLRNNRREQCAYGGFVCLYELSAPLAFVPIYFYNGERGRQNKWFFYIIYPTHLLFLYAIRWWWLGW